MSEQTGEKTELPTQKKLEEAFSKGQIARSPEIQTVFVLGAALTALSFSGPAIWKTLASTMASSLSHLHDTPLSLDVMQGFGANAALVIGRCAGPVLLAATLGGLLAGGMQTKFRVTPEALGIHWERLNPLEGFKRIFSTNASVGTGLGIVKLSVIVSLSFSVIKKILADPIFYTSVDVARIAGFMADSSIKILSQVTVSLVVIAALDYAYKFWKTSQDLMMTKEEVKEESKNTEGNPQVKSRQRRRRQATTKRKMLAEVPKADVIVTNPTHIAIALRYDRKTMKAPRIVAKGTRLNALRIREIAKEHQVPIIENKPLARLMFKYGKVGGEIPAQLYAAVAEVLAWVYRVNAYRYYREQNA
ncbi:MAG TPA: flagellar biosynthesis protein FlhB [Verrucomicrobiae bacterium]|jgi:flagellar biosynthetic protein FlhB|nr:flagellar biosynthesis protein FlhB [Verrucomicrobiae bacterium]